MSDRIGVKILLTHGEYFRLKGIEAAYDKLISSTKKKPSKDVNSDPEPEPEEARGEPQQYGHGDDGGEPAAAPEEEQVEQLEKVPEEKIETPEKPQAKISFKRDFKIQLKYRKVAERVYNVLSQSPLITWDNQGQITFREKKTDLNIKSCLPLMFYHTKRNPVSKIDQQEWFSILSELELTNHIKSLSFITGVRWWFIGD